MDMHKIKTDEIEDERRDLSYWLKRVSFFILYFIVWIIVCFKNWGKRQSLPPIKNELLKISATKLAEEIRLGKIKSSDVIQAYIDRILEVNLIINAVADDNFEGALEEAKAVDVLIESGKYSVEELRKNKPILGVPFTVKILISVKGFRLTAGSLVYKDHIATENADAVEHLKEAGGIFLAMTNTAEFGSAAEANNIVHGTTYNPYDTTRTPGGSSGGEGALLGAAGSLIGLGNDVLGSIRIPANFCCLFAHKATAGWISNEGCVPPVHPSSSHMLYVGPMCRYAEDLVTLTNILSSKKEREIALNKSIDFRKLKIYYQAEIKHVLLSSVDKEITKGILDAAFHFQKTYGVEVKEVNIPMLQQSSRIGIHTMQAEIPNNIAHVTGGKIKNLNAFYEFIKIILGRPTFTFMVILSACFGKNRLFFTQKDAIRYEKLSKRMGEMFDDLLDENSIFILPTLSTTTPYNFESHFCLPNAVYTAAFNLLGLPVTQCPLGLNKNGMPFGFQIASRRGNDALTMACALELEKVFRGWIPPEIAFKSTK